MHEHGAVRLDDEQAQGLGEVGGEPADQLTLDRAMTSRTTGNSTGSGSPKLGRRERAPDRRDRCGPPDPVPGPERVESWPDGDWVVRRVPAGAAKAYRCPGCDQEIAPGTPHVVAWPLTAPGCPAARPWTSEALAYRLLAEPAAPWPWRQVERDPMTTTSERREVARTIEATPGGLRSALRPAGTRGRSTAPAC